MISRETGDQRFWVWEHADRRTCAALIAANVAAGSTWLYTNAWQSYRGSHPCHATLCHSLPEWAHDDDGDGRREVHGNTCEEVGAGLHPFQRLYRSIHTAFRYLYVTTYEAMSNVKQVTPALIQRMCRGDPSLHTS